MRSARTAAVAVVLAIGVCGGLTSCGDGSGTESWRSGQSSGRSSDFRYDSERVAPRPDELTGDGSDVTPDAEDALAEVELESGATAAVWIDPDDLALVHLQHSDPADPGAWTGPELLFEAGGGCLWVDADAQAGTVAVAVGCYEDDVFRQQAPDQCQLLVTTDIEEWDREDAVEFIGAPEVAEGGDEVIFVNSVYEGDTVTWNADGGF